MLGRVFLASVIVVAAHARLSAPPAVVPPAISLDLSAQLAQKLHSTQTDALGRPCRSPAADTSTCGHHAQHVQYYATCEVLRDSESSCPEPEASAHDHHEGEIPIRKTVKLYIKSDAKHQPELLDQIVPAVSYRQRGEYTLTYDATDSSGNSADSIVFHFFLVDHTAPKIHIPVLPTARVYERYYTLPRVIAVDDYDGLVSETLTLSITEPDGHVRTYSGRDAHTPSATIDMDKKGHYEIRWLAHDYAGAFGLKFHNNARVCQTTVDVGAGRELQSTGEQYCKVTTEGSLGTGAPTPAPTPHTPAPTPHYVNCEVSSWGAWGACSAPCGSGVSSRQREVTRQAAWGGAACPHMHEVQDCHKFPCPVSCQSEWLPWTNCDRSCGGGIRARRVSVIRHPQYGGRACPENQLQTCNTAPCPTPAPTPHPTRPVRVPPVLILSFKNEIIARGGAWGVHGNEHKYRKHLKSNGYTDEEVENHVAAIAEREQQIEELLGQNGKWWMPDRGVMNKHDNSPVAHGDGTSDGVVPFSPHPHT